MVLTKDSKQEIIKRFQQTPSDTGSAEVQIALLTNQIGKVAVHLDKHAKDQHTRRGLIKMVSKRRRLLDYLETRSTDRIKKLKKALKI